MAVYPDGHPGVWPVDPASLVGQVRYATGDYEAVEYDPAEAGYRNFAAFSDSEIEAMLTLGGGSALRAVGFAYLKIAGLAAGEAVEWATDDLRLNLSKKSSELRAIAQTWFERADESDDRYGVNDIFEIFDTVGDGDFIPEASTPVWGRRYVWDRTTL